MNSQEILQALQAGQISLDMAREELMRQKATLSNAVTASAGQLTKPETAPEITDKKMDIAIVGMAGRYPDARNMEQYWENLAKGRNSIREIPATRWNINQYYDPRPSQTGKIYCKWLGALEDIESFDPLFFNISPSEAEIMDPQHRIFLEEGYKAFEDSCYNIKTLSQKKCGLYLGIMSNEYSLLLYQERQSLPSAAGNSNAIAAARLSYFLNLKGPAMAIDTACSSALVATHLACQALRHGEVDMALVGGVTLYLVPESYMVMCASGMLSRDGQCKTFDNRADGFVPGEGAGALVLKRLKDAEADHDQIYGVIIGSGINQDGKTNGITAPSISSQMDLEREVLDKYRIDPESISYVEMHGTGTKLGDPIELEALATVFKEKTNQKNYCAIGSVKSNIGHTSAAAGIASIQKVLLCMKHQKLVPTLNYTIPNEHFEFADSPFYVNVAIKPWETLPGRLRRAGVSGFGFSGTNAHLVIEEYRPKDIIKKAVEINSSNPMLFILSAKTGRQLKVYTETLHDWISSHAAVSLADIAYTLQVGREAMEYRLAFLADSRANLLKAFEEFMAGDTSSGALTAQVYNKITDEIFEKDREAKSLLQNWIQKRNLKQIAEAWLKGWPVDWHQLYKDPKPCRISLPAYPFAKEYYWAPGNGFKPTSNITAASGEETPVKRDMCFLQKKWEICPSAPPPSLERNVVILTTQGTMELAVSLAHYFSKSKILNLSELEAPIQLPDEEWINFNGLVDLVGYGPDRSESLDWIILLKRLIEYGARENFTALCVTKGLESYQNKTINLAGASRAGLYRMLQSEYPHLRSYHLDMDPDCGVEESASLIAAEFGADIDTVEFCYRNGRRYCAILEEKRADANSEQHYQFSEGQVLWITGGTRGIGYLCAQHFVKCYGVKKLVLTGKQPMPPREEWSFDKEHTPLTAKKISNILALESLGAQVKVLSVPLTDKTALEQSLQEVKDTMGPVGGLIHSAGIIDTENPALIRKSPAGMGQVLTPKITGLDMMYQVFKNEPLKFFLLFSSVSAIIPGLASGQSDYAMANAYMDYFAEAVQAGATFQGYPVVSIQWPSWKETGMGEAKSRAYRQTGLFSHTNTEGLQLLDYVLSGKPGPVVLPALINRDIWRPENLMRRATGVPPATGTGSPLTASRKTSDSANIFVEAIQKWLLDLFSEKLKIHPSRLDSKTPFQDYGVDSIMLTQLLQPINQLLTDPLDPSILYEYQTIGTLAVQLAQNHASSLAKALGIPYTEPEIPPVQGPAIPALEEQWNLKGEFQTGFQFRHIPKQEDIAVIGLACRFPGANTLHEYWRLLAEGRSAIHHVPRARWGYANSFYAGLLDKITYFDPKFFLIPEADARVMDPQALLLLEECLNLWYHAGYNHQEMKGKPVGVYIGGRGQHKPDATGLHQARNPIVAVGQNYLAANISQFFDLRGPSLVLDTACSSALISMNTALGALRDREIEAAVVGGVSLLQSDAVHQMFQQRGILSDEPYYHIFDQRAKGVVLGEGIGMVLLKSASKALEDGDHIYAVIKALAVNNDGRTAGPATPNIQAQKEVLQAALAKSGISPEEISFIETNGSGSEITDLIELKVLESVYRPFSKTPCGLGSMKPNIGHPLCAEGIAGFIKMVLMLQYRQLVPFLSGERSLKHYDIKASPFYFCRQTEAWTNTPLLGAINCFADGGTNAHVILEAGDNFAGRSSKRHPLPPPELNRYDIREIGPGDMPEVSFKEPENLERKSSGNDYVANQISNRINKFWKRETVRG